MNNPSLFPTLPIALLAAAFTLHPSSFIRAQGTLTPPGPPAATMKTLQQIEPRIDLQNAPTSAVTTNNAAYHFIITQPGSYYLSANLGVTKTNGIQINAEGVTLDLSGFEISRASSTGGTGIEIPATSHRASVRNGSLKGFSSGIISLFSGSYPKGCAFRDLAVSACTSVGIYAGSGAVLESCRAHDNSGSFGIYASPGSTLSNCSASYNTAAFGIFVAGACTLSNCSASYNTATYGIYVDSGCSLSNCSARGNTSDASVSAGIGAVSDCTLSHCNAYNNFSTAATFTPTTGMGFYVLGRSTIQNCTASGNSGAGVNTGSGCSILDCTVSSNIGAGIRAASGCTVTRCTLPNNAGYGLYAEADCAISQCVAGGTTGTGVGLRVGNNSSVTGCTASVNNTDGIQLTTRCHATNNSVSGNTGAGIRSAGTDFTVRNSLNGNTGGNLVPESGGNIAPLQQASGATNPWANLQ